MNTNIIIGSKNIEDVINALVVNSLPEHIFTKNYNDAIFSLLKSAIYRSDIKQAEEIIQIIKEKNPNRVWPVFGDRMLTLFEDQKNKISPEAVSLFKKTVDELLPETSVLSFYEILQQRKKNIINQYGKDKNIAQKVETVDIFISWVSERLEKRSTLLPLRPKLNQLTQSIKDYQEQKLTPEEFGVILKSSGTIVRDFLGYCDFIQDRQGNKHLQAFNRAEFEKIMPDVREFIRVGHKLFSSIDNIINYHNYFYINEKQNFTTFFFNHKKFIPALIKDNTHADILKLSQSALSQETLKSNLFHLFFVPNINNAQYWTSCLDKSDDYLLKYSTLFLSCIHNQKVPAQYAKLFPKMDTVLKESDMRQYASLLLIGIENTFKNEKNQEKLQILISKKNLSLTILPNEPAELIARKKHKI